MVDKNQFYVPSPQDTPAANPQPGKRAPTPLERVQEAKVKGLELKAFEQSSGLSDTGNASGDKGQGLDSSKMGEILATTTNQFMKSYAEGLTTLVTKLAESQASMAAGGKQPQKDEFLQYLIGEMREMRAKLEGGQGDPLEAIDQYHQKMLSWQEQMRTQFGVGPLGAAAGTGNVEVMKLMLEVEDRKTERAQLQVNYNATEQEKNRRYMTERDDLHRQWEKEDKRWDAEFKLKLAQLNLDGENRGESVSTFKDLAGAFVASLKVNQNAAPGAGAGQGAAAAQASEQTGVNFPVSFTCTEPDPETGAICNTHFPWPAGQMKANCPKCGAEYSLKAAQ